RFEAERETAISPLTADRWLLAATSNEEPPDRGEEADEREGNEPADLPAELLIEEPEDALRAVLTRAARPAARAAARKTAVAIIRTNPGPAIRGGGIARRAPIHGGPRVCQRLEISGELRRCGRRAVTILCATVLARSSVVAEEAVQSVVPECEREF